MTKRIRIEYNEKYKDDYNARIVQTMETGTIAKKYISKKKQEEAKEYGFAYTNQPPERIV